MASAEYDVLRDEVVPLMKDIADDLSNLISAHNRSIEYNKSQDERNMLLTELKVQQSNLDRKLTEFIAAQVNAQSTFWTKQNELENKVTRLMAYGGALITIVTLVIHYIGGK